MAVTETTEQDQKQDQIGPFRRRVWWHRHLPPEERRRVMADLAVTRVDNWTFRFVMMLTLSVIVAVMGLSLNSAAVVIGAMLLAPLMQPVLACGACLSMALFTKGLIAGVKVALATAWCIAIAYAISVVLPDAELTSEVLGRTQPDIKDLVVALAAGAAGAYATVRADVSSSLPGVAVAVALVPPLASVGITLEAGANDLALGALLLYLTNFAAIVFASIVVFVATGFVPPRRLSDNLLRLATTAVALSALVILVTVPLYRASIESIDRNTEQRAADAIVSNWLGDLDDDLTSSVVIKRSEQQVVVEVRGFEAPPDQSTLQAAMQAEFPGYDVPVQWIRTERATTTTVAPPLPTDQLLADIRVEVEAWLDESGLDYQIDDIKLNGNLVRIDAAGTGDPPSIEGLLPRLEALDATLSPGLNWATLEVITEETPPTPLELTAADLQVIVEEWATSRGLTLNGFIYDGQRAEIDVAGSREPLIFELQRSIRDRVGEEIPVSVYFTERLLITTTVPPIPEFGPAPTT